MHNLADIHAGAGETRSLPVRRQALPARRPAQWLSEPNTHAYGNRDLLGEERLEMDMPELPGTELVIERRQPRQEAPHEPEQDEESHGTTLQVVRRELQFKRKHTRVEKELAKRGRRDSNGEEIGGDEFEQVPEGDENGELTDAQLRQAERAAAARPGAATRIGDVIERICARGNLQVPTSPPRRLPAPRPQRAGRFKSVNLNYGFVTFLLFHRTKWSVPAAYGHFGSPNRLLIRRGGRPTATSRAVRPTAADRRR